MEQMHREPEFSTVQMLVKKLNVTSTRIELDFQVGVIKQFAFQYLNRQSKLVTRKRIKTLLPILNRHAREHLLEGPANIIIPKIIKQLSLSEAQQSLLTENIESNNLFELWLKEYGINIDHIKLVFPKDEALKYESYLKNTSLPTMVNEGEPFDEKAYVANKRESINCKRSSCVDCQDIKCRKGLVNDLSTNYGRSTGYGINLCNIGVAMGLPEPPRPDVTDFDDLKKSKRKIIDKVKSQVKRWQKEDPDKKSRRHSPFSINHTSTSHRNVS